MTILGVGALFAKRAIRDLAADPTNTVGRSPASWIRILGTFVRQLIHTGLLLVAWRLRGLSAVSLPVFASRFDLLGLAAKGATKAGLWLEFGVYRGETVNLLASYTESMVYGFDSFEGLPSDWTFDYPSGAFSTEGNLPKVSPNVRLVRGLFANTLPGFTRDHRPLDVSLLHIDSDLYSSAREVLFGLQEGIRVGTIIVFDEYVTLYPQDESKAFQEFLRATRHSYRYVGCSVEGSVAVRITTLPSNSGNVTQT